MTKEKNALAIVVLYNAAANDYSIAAHNQSPVDAERLRAEYNPHLKPGFSLISIEQERHHKAPDAQTCRACRDAVRRNSGLEPSPKFIRRKP